MAKGNRERKGKPAQVAAAQVGKPVDEAVLKSLVEQFRKKRVRSVTHKDVTDIFRNLLEGGADPAMVSAQIERMGYSGHDGRDADYLWARHVMDAVNRERGEGGSLMHVLPAKDYSMLSDLFVDLAGKCRVLYTLLHTAAMESDITLDWNIGDAESGVTILDLAHEATEAVALTKRLTDLL